MTDTAHARVQDAFSAYLEGDLDPAQKQSVDQHLGTCIQCRTELERFRTTLGRLGSLRTKAPHSLLPDVQRQIYRRSRGRFFARRWLLFGRIPFEWVSLLMILAMLVYYVITTQSAPTSVTPTP